jgi:hypothetical protein
MMPTGSTAELPRRRWRASRLATSVAVTLGLIRVGEFLHTRADVSPVVRAFDAADHGARVPIEATPIAAAPVIVPAPVATGGSLVQSAPKATAKPVAKRSARPSSRRDAAAKTSAQRPAPVKKGVLDRLHLGWLRKAFTERP